MLNKQDQQQQQKNDNFKFQSCVWNQWRKFFFICVTSIWWLLNGEMPTKKNIQQKSSNKQTNCMYVCVKLFKIFNQIFINFPIHTPTHTHTPWLKIPGWGKNQSVKPAIMIVRTTYIVLKMNHTHTHTHETRPMKPIKNVDHYYT